MELYVQAVQKWRVWNVATAVDLDQYLAEFRILFAYHSGKIENSEVTYRVTQEIFERGNVFSYTGNLRPVLEQQNQKFCYEVLKEKIVNKEPVSIELIQDIHRILTSGAYDEQRYIVKGERPGEFKKHDYVTGIHEVGSTPENVQADLEELIDEVNEIGAKAPLKAGAYLHARFESIHPFADGNGRVGRTLLNYWLMINDYPPMIIYDEDKHEYYRALQEYDEREELSSLVDFFERQSVKTWDRTMKLTNASKCRC